MGFCLFKNFNLLNMVLYIQQTCTKNSCSLVLSLLISLSFLLGCSLSEPRATEAGFVCSRSKAPSTQRQTFVSNFLAALDSLTSQVTLSGYGSSINGTGNLSVYAFGECMKDVIGSDCNLCIAQIKTRIDKCLPYERLTRGGRVFFDGCYLRYDDHDFRKEILSKEDETVCGSKELSGKQNSLIRNVVDLMKNLSAQGAKNGGFSFGSLRRENLTVYGLVQCWEHTSSSACGTCLANAVSRVSSCPPKIEGRALNSGCYMRYSTHKFYNNSRTPLLVQSHDATKHLDVALAASLSALAFVVLLTAAVFLGGEKCVKKQREKKQLGTLLSIVNNSKLSYSYETLEEATNYFHDSNKLGQGGSGSVYKGILPDGRVVAVKRLFFNTRQWVDHFFNEIDLISSIQHKNLVKLLGCSITGPESLLVYEFVPNLSLHAHLFAGKDVKTLSWEARYTIILGTAEGLAYLHEDSTLRIIHRDIKLNNILLDHDLTPKIADFGLVRLLPQGKTHLSTAIAGTLGYMAPEYIVCGKLTEKVDVYSFGVVLIEVMTGKKNCKSFSEDSMCMLHKIWSLHTKGLLHEAVDETLEGQFPEEEACRVLQIGLLCVQADVQVRPSMSRVVKMLRDKDCEVVSEPTQPPFLNSSSAEITRQLIQQESSRHSLVAASQTTSPESASVSESLLDAPHFLSCTHCPHDS